MPDRPIERAPPAWRAATGTSAFTRRRSRRSANGRNLNLLAAQAQKQLSDLQQQRGGLQALVDTLPDPILAADPRGRITLLNAPGRQIASLAAAAGARTRNSSTSSAMSRSWSCTNRSSAPAAQSRSGPTTMLNREIRLVRNGQRRTYQAVATRTAGGGALLVLRDVSTLAGTMQMKTDFVANASHELRTPIAAIKIAFETLRDVYRDDPAQADRCISVIDGHLKRLEEMLRDLDGSVARGKPRSQAQRRRRQNSETAAVVHSTMGATATAEKCRSSSRRRDPSTPENSAPTAGF